MRKRLWQMGSMLAVVTLLFAVSNFFVPDDKAVTSRMLGHDFLAFYTAGTFVREGHPADIYDLAKVADFQHRLAQQANLDLDVSLEQLRFGPYWNPPFYAALFAPLSLLSFRVALLVWTTLNVAALGGSLWLLVRMIRPAEGMFDGLGRPIDWKTTGLVPFLILLSMPFVQAIAHGQNTMISLFLLTSTVTLWRAKRAVLAGAICALLAYKPQLAAAMAAVMVFSLGWRALAGLLFVGSTIVLVSQFTMPDMLAHYLQRLPENIRYMQVEHEYHLWERHATLKAFWRLLFQGKSTGEMSLATMTMYGLSVVGLACLLGRAVWSQRHATGVDDCWSATPEKVWRDRLITATICAAPLLMPFYFDYDLLLLSIPAVLLASEHLTTSDPVRAQATRWIRRMWVIVYAVSLFNPGIAGSTRVNVNVILLSLLSVLLADRATRPIEVVEPIVASRPKPVTITRKAA